MCSALLIIVLAYVFVELFRSIPTWQNFFEVLLRVEGIPGTEILMLPLSFSIGMIINAGVFWFLFQRDTHEFSRPMLRVSFEILSASVVMGFVTHQFLSLFDDVFDINTFWGIFAQGFFSGILGIIAGVTLLILLGNREIREIKGSLLRKFWKTQTVGGEGTEL